MPIWPLVFNGPGARVILDAHDRFGTGLAQQEGR